MRTLLSSKLKFPGFILLTITIILLGIGISITRPFLSLYLTNVIHMSPFQLGLFMCLNALGGIIASTWLGKYSDATGARKGIMLLSSFASVLGYLAFLLLHQYVLLLIVTTLLLGLGSSTFPQIFAYARESAIRTRQQDATFAVSTLRSFFSLAWVIGPLAGATLLSISGFHGLFLITASLFLIAFFIVLWRLQNTKNQSTPHQRPKDPISLWKTLKRWDVFAASIAFIFANSALSMNGLYMPLLVTKAIGAPQSTVGIVASLSAFLEIPIIILLGSIVGRFKKRSMLLIGCLSATIYYFGMAFSHSALEVLLLQIVCAINVSVLVSIGMSYFQDFLPHAPGTTTTLYSNTSNLGSLIGSIGGGLVAQLIDFRFVFVLCGILALSALFFLYIGKTKKPEQLLP